MWRVSSGVSTRPPIPLSRPFTSTSGGFPGEKNRSLIFGALRNIPANNPGTENGAAAGLAAAAGDDAVAGAVAEALACGSRAGAAAAAVPIAFGLLPRTALLDDDMGLEPNRPKFSQNSAAASDYEGHAGFACISPVQRTGTIGRISAEGCSAS